MQLKFTQGDTLNPGHPHVSVPKPGGLLMDAARQVLSNWGDYREAADTPNVSMFFGKAPKTITSTYQTSPGGMQRLAVEGPALGSQQTPAAL